jgi:hypothetical protein
MYTQASPGTIANMITAMENFLQGAGFQTTLSSGAMNWSGGQNATTYNDITELMVMNGWTTGTPAPTVGQTPVTVLTAKDPGSTQTYAMAFYTLGSNRLRRGIYEESWYMDYRMNNRKAGVLFNLPGSVEALDMFAGTNSDGRLWAHFAIEEKPLVYSHLAFGTIEKFMSFTGGDFITAHFLLNIIGAVNASVYAYSCATYNWTNFVCTNAMYAPNLDAANKIDPGHDYRSLMSYVTGYAHAFFEPGHTSLRVLEGATWPASIGYTAKSGGEISIPSFPLPNSWTGNSPLFPVMTYANNGQNTDYSGACGYYSGVRVANIANYQARDEIVMGSEIWKVYPVVAKEGVLGNAYTTHNQGYAVLKNG